jgi:O-antigen/teichoic acid export membrane protein
MLVTVALRYGGIALQFVVLAILARHLTVDDYGRYMLVLGAVWATYTLLGLGASETFVREAPVHVQRGRPDEVAALAGGTLTVALGTAAFVALVGGVLMWLLALDPTTTTLVAFILAFVVANGLVFNAAQMLLGGGFHALGSFFYYPAVNLSLLISSVPYVFLSATPTFQGVAIATSSAGLLMAAVAILLVMYRIRPAWATVATIGLLVRVGIRLSFARALGYLGVWLPTFLAGVLLAPVQAGYLGTANRLAFAVGAVTAAVRFAVRPAIVRAFDREDRASINETCGRLATVTFTIACLAIVVSAVTGHSLIAIAFGPDLVSAAPLLTILLLGIAFEAFCGPVDEVLKMTGHENRVSTVLMVAVASSTLAIFVVARPLGVTAMAWVQVGYSVMVFGTMILIARHGLGIWLHPIIPRSPTSLSATRGHSEGRLDG